MGRLTVRDVMTPNVATIDAEAPVKTAVELMWSRDVSGLPVTDPGGAVLGMITEGDVVRKAGRTVREHEGALARMFARPRTATARRAAGRYVREVMSAPAIVAHPDDEVRRAARRMSAHEVKRLPVVEEGRLVGIISRRDVMELFARTDEALERAVRTFLEGCGFVPPEATIKIGVYDGVVGLSGTVANETDERVVEALVASVDGVVDVSNRLHHSRPDPKRHIA